jgi:para-nitrobenzyl esterase
MRSGIKVLIFLLGVIGVLAFCGFGRRTGVYGFRGSGALARGVFERVKVEGGLVSGVRGGGGEIHIFKGVPFAAAPVGALRWKSPQPVVGWQGVKVCDHFGPSPMQNKPAAFSMWSEEFLIPATPISEDCLYLNVWTGAKSGKEKRPVLVWIYGGGFGSGGSGVPIYDGEAMAKKGIIFVSINYRVGIFGFFAHSELTKESANHSSGNYGLMDQLAGLKWVQNNITAFGGDPNNVTIAGQSAGSMSVNCLVASPLAKNLFQKAIAESGAEFIKQSPTLSSAEAEGQRLMQSMKLASIADLRAVPAEDLQRQPGNLRGPIVDGYVLPDAVFNIFAAGKENKISLLTGWNEDEGILFESMKSAADFTKDMHTKYGVNAGGLLQYYPAQTDSQAVVSQLRLSRDMIFGVENYTFANVEGGRGAKVYVYRFKRKPPATGEYLKYGAFHTAEVPYAYNNLRFVNRPWEPVDHRLADLMSTYWVNFVRNGNPNGKGLPVWDAYSPGTERVMFLSEQSGTANLPDKAGLDLLFKTMSSE